MTRRSARTITLTTIGTAVAVWLTAAALRLAVVATIPVAWEALP